MRDPFHDLHHHETGSTSHIRLISEGGSSHARSPDLVCIDSIQATLTCTTEAQHAVYPAIAQGTAPPENPLVSPGTPGCYPDKGESNGRKED